MKHLVLIMAHKNITQLVRLILKLNSDFYCLVHLDNKTNISLVEKNTLDSLNNTFICKNPMSVNRADFSMIQVVRMMFAESLEIERVYNLNFSYYVLISGMDYPLKPQKDVKLILDSNFPKPILNVDLPCDSDMVKNIFKRFRFVKFHTNNPLKKIQFTLIWYVIMSPLYLTEYVFTFFRNRPANLMINLDIVPITGNAWWILSKSDLNEIFSYLESNRILHNIYKYLLTPEEHFFQTLYFKLHPEINIYDFVKRQTIEQTFVLFTHPNKYYDGIDGHPYTFLEDDYLLLKSSKALFARKFDILVDDEILKKLDRLSD